LIAVGVETKERGGGRKNFREVDRWVKREEAEVDSRPLAGFTAVEGDERGGEGG